MIHVTEVPELWDAQRERDLRHACAAIRKHRAVTLVTAGASITAMAFGAPFQATFLFLLFGIQSAETWLESAETRRRMRRDLAGYFHRCAREVRYVFGVHTIRDSAV